MRSLPPDLAPERLAGVLAERWGLRVVSLEYMPQGGGSHHWTLTSGTGRRYFVTVDDLDNKEWLGDARDAAFDGLRRALGTAAALRYGVGLPFVIAPIAARGGQPVCRIDSRYAASLLPFLTGRSYPFGPYTDGRLRSQVLDMIVALHQATPRVRNGAPRHVVGFAGRHDLQEFLRAPGQPWESGHFAETVRTLLRPHTADLGQLVIVFDQLAASTRPASAQLVITHGEPHPANIMTADSQLALIDWDTVALAPPERDVSLIAPNSEVIERYQEATGRELNSAVIGLYRLRWYLDDLASATRLFRNCHRDTPDTRRWRLGLARHVEQLPSWLDRLS